MSVGPDMRRRGFLGLVGGALVAGINPARAQQGSRRVEVLMGAAEMPSSRDWVAAFLRRLDELGWRDGHNLVVQVQWEARNCVAFTPAIHCRRVDGSSLA